jgi:hypothetical protein
MKILTGILAGILLSLAASSAGAVVLFSPTPSGTGDNVLFNLQPPNQMGTTIFGNINNPGNTLVQFTSSQVLIAPSLGQARIESVPADILNNLQTIIPGFLFGQAVFNLDATANGTATINAFDQSGTLFSFPLALSGNGQNFFTLTTAGGELISRVTFTSTVGLEDVAQIRFGELTPSPVPLPPAVLLFGTVLLGVGVLARRKRSAVQTT